MQEKKKGFTLIEALVLVIIFSIMTLGFYRVYGLVMVTMIDAKKRLVAVEIANQELETLRNMPYEDIALISDPSLPPASVGPGPVAYDSTIVLGGATYRVIREIYFIDDSEDGLGPTADVYAQDYKNVVITVRWGNAIDDASVVGSQVKLSSYYVPPRGNELGITEGVVSVNVIDITGAVSGIYVSITDINGAAAPNYVANALTDATGNVTFPAVPAGQKVYRVTVGDGTDNYEIISTLPDYPTTPFYPIYTDLTTVPGTITTLTVENNEIPDLEFYSVDPFCEPIGNVTLDLAGGRILGTDTSGDPVYLNGSLSPISITTDSNGYYDMDSLSGFVESAGKYEVGLSSGAYTLWRLLPGDDVDRFATQIDPNTSVDCNVLLMDNALDSVFVDVVDQDTGAPVPDAAIRLRNVGLGYSVISQSDKYGTAYFPENDTNVLVGGEQYELRVTGDEYVDNLSLVTVTGLEQLTVTMEALVP